MTETTEAAARTITDRYLAVWNEPDAQSRRTAIESLWEPSCACAIRRPPGILAASIFRAQNVGSLIANFRAAGAQCVIVNGVLGRPALRPSCCRTPA